MRVGPTGRLTGRRRGSISVRFLQGLPWRIITLSSPSIIAGTRPFFSISSLSFPYPELREKKKPILERDHIVTVFQKGFLVFSCTNTYTYSLEHIYFPFTIRLPRTLHKLLAGLGNNFNDVLTRKELLKHRLLSSSTHPSVMHNPSNLKQAHDWIQISKRFF